MKFDENLRNLRREKDYSQEYLAGVMNVSRQTVSKWENGSAMPDLKRLTQLAELFEVSMDTLLGIDYPSKDNISPDAGDANNNASNNFDGIIAFIEADHKAILSRTKKILAVTISVILIAAVIITSSIVSDLKFSISQLQDQVQMLNSNQAYYNNSDASEQTYTEWELVGIDPQKPYIVNVRFTYSPTTYAKNTSVYFLIPQKDGGHKRIDADPVKAEQGIFTADCQIDVTNDVTNEENYYTIVDDGENITKEEFYSDFSSVYLSFMDGFYTINSSGTSALTLTISNGSLPSVYTNYGGNVKSARQIVKLNGKELFNSDVKLSKSETDDGALNLSTVSDITLEVPDSVNNDEPDKLDFYYEFDMEMGYTVRYYPMILDHSEMTYIFDIDEGNEYYEYIFNIDGKEVIVRG